MIKRLFTIRNQFAKKMVEIKTQDFSKLEAIKLPAEFESYSSYKEALKSRVAQ